MKRAHLPAGHSFFGRSTWYSYVDGYLPAKSLAIMTPALCAAPPIRARVEDQACISTTLPLAGTKALVAVRHNSNICSVAPNSPMPILLRFATTRWKEAQAGRHPHPRNGNKKSAYLLSSPLIDPSFQVDPKHVDSQPGRSRSAGQAGKPHVVFSQGAAIPLARKVGGVASRPVTGRLGKGEAAGQLREAAEEPRAGRKNDVDARVRPPAKH